MSATPAVHALRRHNIPFTEHPYRYEEHGGTRVSSRELGVPEHMIIKTLVMQDGDKKPLIVLMHGDREVSTKALARAIGAKAIEPCQPDVAEKFDYFHYELVNNLAEGDEEKLGAGYFAAKA